MKPTPEQLEFFMRLCEEKDFDVDDKGMEKIQNEFAKLDKRSASAWIERALSLPKRREAEGAQIVQPSF
jgi:hypothetical protein